MIDWLLDTNHASKLMAGAPPITDRVRFAHSAGERFGLSMTAVGELYYAVFASHRQEENLRRLERLLEALIIWPFDEDAARMFGQIQAKQKAAGRPIPPLDAQIASVARVHGLRLLTADQHFQLVAGLVIENWLE